MLSRIPPKFLSDSFAQYAILYTQYTILRSPFSVIRFLMNILHYGLTCFKITTRPGGRSTEELTVFIDPIAQEEGMRDVYGRADLVLLTSQESEPNLSSLKGDPFVINLPGEYSHKGINVLGFDGGEVDGKFLGKKTAYLIETEDMRVAHLGTAGSVSEEAQSAMNGCDVLMIPVGGNGAFSASSAAAIVRAIEPRVTIPMYYHIPSAKVKLESPEAFYGEMAVKDKEVLPKFSTKSKDIEKRSRDIVELTPQRG